MRSQAIQWPIPHLQTPPHREDGPSTATIQPMLSMGSIAKILDVDYYTICDMRYAGRIPPPDLMLKNRPRWKQSTIQQLIDSGSI
jgi:hypothetical protein